MAGIYYHIPFCKRICGYCDFYRTALMRDLPQVVEKMAEEIRHRSGYLEGEAITTRYFGGGTPSLCSPDQIATLLTATSEVMDCSHVVETTLEANPDDLTTDYLEGVRRAGIDRLSIGIQSFDDECLRLMNRRHTAQEAVDAVHRAQAVGFDNITIDLIFGVPGFGGDSLRRSIDQALDLGVQHISAYLLSIEPNTRFGKMAERGELIPIDDEEAQAAYLLMHSRLTEAGFDHYEISNYALPGFEARHNSSYWSGVKYLGIGPAAHSYDGHSRQWNVSSVTRYLAGEAPEVEQLGEEEHLEEWLMTRLRTRRGLNLEKFEQRFGKSLTERLLKAARSHLENGSLVASEGHIAIPVAHLMTSDYIIGSLFGL
ncbi:MAG: radical SAM family heme chaperone HemW [Alistipes sp.]|nr:radical SAM family heme chaperone HemW [Alistipes sp.]